MCWPPFVVRLLFALLLVGSLGCEPHEPGEERPKEVGVYKERHPQVPHSGRGVPTSRPEIVRRRALPALRHVREHCSEDGAAGK